MRLLTRALPVVLLVATVAGQHQARAQVPPTPAPPAPPAPPAAEPTPPTPPPSPEPAPAAAESVPVTFDLPSIDVHGFVSQGALVSTHNDYLGHSKRGSVELTEAAVNFSTEPADRLRVGAQLFTRDIGPVGDYKMTLDWAFLDYRWRPYLGLRAGRVKLPFGLHNEYSDIDSARLPILLPQSIYPILNRDLLLAHTGFSIYGSLPIGPVGGLDYQAYYGTWFIDKSLFGNTGGPITILSVETRRVAGGQIFWRPPLENLRLGGSLLYAAMDFNLKVDPMVAQQLIASGMAPPGFDGTFKAALDPVYLWISSGEYAYRDWQFSAEYSRWKQTTTSGLPALAKPGTTESERYYAMVSLRLDDQLEAGAYYSVQYSDVGDRDGSKRTSYPERAWQRDLAGSVRYDVNESWLWKLESHFMDGAAYLAAADNPNPKRYWWLFLVKTTVFF
jgi:hypothetical protein